MNQTTRATIKNTGVTGMYTTTTTASHIMRQVAIAFHLVAMSMYLLSNILTILPL